LIDLIFFGAKRHF